MRPSSPHMLENVSVQLRGFHAKYRTPFSSVGSRTYNEHACQYTIASGHDRDEKVGINMYWSHGYAL